MRPALLVFLYGLAVAWHVPALLTRLTARGVSARLGLAAWLAAMVSVLASAAAALQFLVRAAAAGWSGLAVAVCRSVAGGACAPATYRNAIFELALAVAAIAAVLAVTVLAWRYGRGVQQGQRRTRAHAEGARVAGRRLPGAGPAVVLDVPQPAAYCLPGRPGHYRAHQRRPGCPRSRAAHGRACARARAPGWPPSPADRAEPGTRRQLPGRTAVRPRTG